MPTQTKGGNNLSVEMHCVGGGGLLYFLKRTLLVAVTEAKMEVEKNLGGSIIHKGLWIEDEVETNYVDALVSKTKARENTVRPLCSLALSVPC